ncbi:MAG TPA: hypothetical protein VFX61_07650 [Micromonosporaceae bacterium]|nr:hypothetical protein [Micromonosporaceae bacterium]
MALATVGILALAGCRPQSGVAAYVGDHEITEDRVTGIVDDLKQKVDEQLHGQLPARIDVVRMLVLGDLCELVSSEKGYQPQQKITAEMVAQGYGMPADSGFVEQVARLHTCLSGVSAPPVAPDPDELADLVARGKAAGVIPAEVPVAEAAAQLDGEQLRGALAQQRLFSEAAETYEVAVSPRYRPLTFPLLSFNDQSIAVDVPLGEPASDAVIDAR